MRQTIADNKNETAKQLEDLKREHSRETTALQLQLMQAKIDELHRKGDAPAPVGIDSATKQTASGQKYVDGSMFHGKDYTAAQQEATAKGVHFLSKDGADALDNIDTARQNLGEINKVVSQLPAGAPGSVIGSVRNFIGGKVNQLETMAPGFNPELQTLGTNIDASVQAGRAVAGSKGLRLNKDLIAVMFKNNTPQLTDSRAVAAEKLAKITKFLDDQEGTVLGTAHAVGTTPKVQKWGRDAQGNPVPLGQ